AELTGQLPAMTADDQLGLLNDGLADADAGYAAMDGYMGLTMAVPERADPVVWTTLARQLADLFTLYDGLPGQPAFRAYALARLQPQAAMLGWDARPGEPANTAGERTAVIAALSAMGDPAVVAEGRRRFAILAAGGALDPAVRKWVLSAAALDADDATWDALHRLARTAPSHLEKTQYYQLLGRARDPALAQRALQLALSGESEPTTAPAIISSVSFLHPKLAFDFVVAHWDQVSPLLDSDGRTSFPARLVRGASDLTLADDLDRFADAHIAATNRQDVRKARAQIAYHAGIRQARLPEIDRWLASGKGKIAAKN
ncbi:MAG: ERAP1-like C-terminal domain-containing protein, partial [Caulobacteraceae bacterium]